MLGDTITFTINAVAKVLKKINQDGYTGEYLLRESTQEIRAFVRHQREKNLLLGQGMDRHQVELTILEFPTEALPAGRQTTVYTVVRNPIGRSATDVGYQVDALGTFVNANDQAVIGWES